MGISPGNLYYHYAAKDELVNSLYDRYERSLSELLDEAGSVGDVEDAWVLHAQAVRAGLAVPLPYGDLNDLPSRNRRLETHFQHVVKNNVRALREVLDGMNRSGAMSIAPRAAEPTADRWWWCSPTG